MALKRGRHLHSAGWPSRWALAHILAVSEIRMYRKQRSLVQQLSWAMSRTSLLPPVLIFLVVSATAAAAAERNLSCARRPCRNLITSEAASTGRRGLDGGGGDRGGPPGRPRRRRRGGRRDRSDDAAKMRLRRGHAGAYKRTGISLIEMEA